LEDVFAHVFFTNLPPRSAETLAFPNHFPGAFVQPTALHVQLVLELLLLCWPNPQVHHVRHASAGHNGFLMTHIAAFRWDWLLLLISLLQQLSTEQKQQFLQERGPLLMQLLYQVLLEDEGLGGCRDK
jgi:hypothetical protein